MHMPNAVSLACGARYMIQEQVGDVHKGKPIEAAVVTIHRNKYKIGPPLGKSYEERIEKRKGHRVYDGMVIKFELFKSESSQNKHAGYTFNVAGRLFTSGLGLCDKAIESKTRFCRKIIRKD